MAVDLQNYQIGFVQTGNLNVAQFHVAGKVVDSQTGALVADLTGANAINFAVKVAAWTQAQHQALIAIVGPAILRIQAGVDPPLA